MADRRVELYRLYLLGFSKVPMALEELGTEGILSYLLGRKEAEGDPKGLLAVSDYIVKMIPASCRE